MTTTDPSLALLQDISQSGPSDPFDELDGTLTADGSGEGKEISWQSFISSKSPHGGMMLDLESNDAIDLGGKSPHGGMLVDLVSNDAIDLGGESHHRRMIVDMESKDPIDLGGEEVSYLSSKNENVPYSDPTKEVAPDEKHSDTIMPSETLDTQNSQDDHVVVGTYDEEFGQEVTVKQHQAWHFAANRRRRLIMCYLGCAILVIVVVLGAVLGTQNKQPSNSSSEVDSIDNPAPTTGNTGALFPGPSSLAPVDPSPTTAIAPGYPPSAVTSPNGTPTIVTAPNGAPIGVPTSLTVDSALTQLLFTVSGSRLFESGSPQLTAANFLRNENRTNYDDAKTIQRYAILTMVASLLNGDMTSVGSIDECDWGVVVCASSGRITELAMTGMGLSGEIPPEISSLQALTTLDLSSNAIRGVLPDEFFSLQNLKYMYLDSNQLSGSLSSLIGNMVQLEVLYLGQNQFNGMIPATLPETLSKSTHVRGRSNKSSWLTRFLCDTISRIHQFLQKQL